MGKATKLWLMIVAALVILGVCSFVSVMTAYDWDFTKLDTAKYETNTYSVSETIHSISMETKSADIRFAVSEDETCKIVCYEMEKVKHSATVQDGTLTIQVNDQRKWYDYIGIHFRTPKITVYLPETAYTSLNIKGRTGDVEIPKDFTFEMLIIHVSTGDVRNYSSSQIIEVITETGDIRVENVSTNVLVLCVSTGKVTARSISCKGDMHIKVSTGDTQLTDVTCKTLHSKGNTGDISLQNVVATEKLSVERSTGDVKLERSDAGEILIQTETGDVKGSLLTEKVFLTHTDTGRVDVPQTITGGKCEIHTDTGNIKITIAS